MEKSKVAFFISTMRGGGAQRVISVLSEYLAKHEKEVDVIATSEDKLDYALGKKVNYIFLNNKNSHSKLDRLLSIKKIIELNKYTHIISLQESSSIYLAILKLIGLRFVFCASERMDPTKDSRTLSFLKTFAYSVADKIVFQTQDAQNYFSKKIQRKSKIIFNPVKADLPDPVYDGRENKVVTAIRLEPQKNPYMLIKAFYLFHLEKKDYTLYIYGDGSMKTDIASYLTKQSMDSYVKLEGFATDVINKEKNAKMFVLSSDYEGVSNAMLEALCIGLPVVSTDHPIGGAKMFIKNGFNGYLSDVGNEKQLAQNLKRIADMDKKEYISMCKNASSIRDKLNLNVVAKEWEDYIFN